MSRLVIMIPRRQLNYIIDGSFSRGRPSGRCLIVIGSQLLAGNVPVPVVSPIVWTHILLCIDASTTTKVGLFSSALGSLA